MTGIKLQSLKEDYYPAKGPSQFQKVTKPMYIDVRVSTMYIYIYVIIIYVYKNHVHGSSKQIDQPGGGKKGRCRVPHLQGLVVPVQGRSFDTWEAQPDLRLEHGDEEGMRNRNFLLWGISHPTPVPTSRSLSPSRWLSRNASCATARAFLGDVSDKTPARRFSARTCGLAPDKNGARVQRCPKKPFRKTWKNLNNNYLSIIVRYDDVCEFKWLNNWKKEVQWFGQWFTTWKCKTWEPCKISWLKEHKMCFLENQVVIRRKQNPIGFWKSFSLFRGPRNWVNADFWTKLSCREGYWCVTNQTKKTTKREHLADLQIHYRFNRMF